MKKYKTWKKWTEEEIKWLKDNSHLFTVDEIALILNRTEYSVRAVLNKFNLKYKKHHLNYEESKNFIEKIRKKNERDFWYLIGFIAGDGYLNKNRKIITIKQKDLDILNSIDIYLLGRTNIIKNKKQDIWEQRISLLYLYDFCEQLGLKNKSKELEIKKEIPAEFFGDFLRGLFDADGGVNIYFSEKGYSFYCDLTTSSFKIVKYISRELEKRKIKHSIRKDNKAYRIRFTNCKSVSQLYSLFYSNYKGLMLVEKKKINFERLIQTICKNNRR